MQAIKKEDEDASGTCLVGGLIGGVCISLIIPMLGLAVMGIGVLGAVPRVSYEEKLLGKVKLGLQELQARWPNWRV